MSELEGKVAIIDGSTRGLGRAIAERFGPIQLQGTADDVAEGALVLCSDRARFIAGDTFHVDGGLHLN